ncbi:quinoprotein dehydrogenase-associated SoxYZ-like carrier [Paracoccus sp. MBLB3053]|uniref:Quinoprotein dehydrogenase-associated SoxYZ-like carrier n=1 Tax=Paracoccus aurantius TaxID=3073814 RepID=A0ABU2HRR1_9RHOB|nr:quinoprotein dehydrogenase-associated SoxYZ-like carrier [Paracoccus sp. MBLB3053]MDS9466984.1 quinoprotein dehydrogenase-associated SoxYZ-like carrier [Paracoccus sp. MBLB3053]
MKLLVLAFTTALLAAGPPLASEVENPLQPSPLWDDLRASILGTDEEPRIDPSILLLDAPQRADNPALVPVHVTQPDGAPAIAALTLVIDGNPAPVAAEFTFGQALMPLDFEVRVRVDTYSDLRAIATLEDGSKVMAGRYVKASGGCAAPAGKSMDEVRATMGEMRFRKADEEGRSIGTLMIRHPNFSGLQRDQLTLLTIPAEFIQTLAVRQDDAELFTMSAGISISEDPVFRFAYEPGSGPVMVHAADTDGRVWDQSF